MGLCLLRGFLAPGDPAALVLLSVGGVADEGCDEEADYYDVAFVGC